MDLVIADRIKDSLTGPCLKYVLANESSKVLSTDELTAFAEKYDAKHQRADIAVTL